MQHEVAWHPHKATQQVQAFLADHFQRGVSVTVPTHLADPQEKLSW